MGRGLFRKKDVPGLGGGGWCWEGVWPKGAVGKSGSVWYLFTGYPPQKGIVAGVESPAKA